MSIPSIRKYTEQDFNCVLKLLALNTPQYFHHSEKEDLEQYLTQHIEDYFIVEINNNIIACGGINKSNNKARISWDIIHPEFQNKGIGSLLLAYRIDFIKKHYSVREIEVRTSQLAFEFYKKNSFVLSQVIENYWAEGMDLYKMEQKLC